jgi:hypothetical protein
LGRCTTNLIEKLERVSGRISVMLEAPLLPVTFEPIEYE